MRRLIAFLFHAPGLWLFYREPIPRRLWAANLIAIGLTLAAVIVGGARFGGGPAFLAWACGHVAWGAVLAATL